jgi:hypothetical protein
MAVRLNSPLYEDGPWLKDPITPDMFRNRQVGTPGEVRLPDLPSQAKARGGSRRVDPSPSVTSVHKAHQSTQYDDTGKRNRKAK